jgi:hypothetical protein
MAHRQPLGTAILERLDERLRAVGAPEALHREPGLLVEEIRSSVAGIPGIFPSEVELWFSWTTWGEDGDDMLPGLRYHTLPGCLVWYREELELSRQLASIRREAGLGALWKEAWLPLSYIDGGVHLVVDVAGSDGIVAPIREVYGQGVGEEFDRVVADSLGGYITAALDAIDAGRWVYDRDEHIWMPSDGRAGQG